MPDYDAIFERIIRKALEEANKVRPLSGEEYIHQLKAWQEEIEVSVQAMRETIGND